MEVHKIHSASLTESTLNYGYVTFCLLRGTGILRHRSRACLYFVEVVSMTSSVALQQEVTDFFICCLRRKERMVTCAARVRPQ